MMDLVSLKDATSASSETCFSSRCFCVEFAGVGARTAPPHLEHQQPKAAERLGAKPVLDVLRAI